MKIRAVTVNNRKKAFEIETTSTTYSFPYALLRVQPDSANRIEEAFPDDPGGHLKVPHSWPVQNPPPSGRRERCGGNVTAMSLGAQPERRPHGGASSCLRT